MSRSIHLRRSWGLTALLAVMVILVSSPAAALAARSDSTPPPAPRAEAAAVPLIVGVSVMAFSRAVVVAAPAAVQGTRAIGGASVRALARVRTAARRNASWGQLARSYPAVRMYEAWMRLPLTTRNCAVEMIKSLPKVLQQLPSQEARVTLAVACAKGYARGRAGQDPSPQYRAIAAAVS